MRVALAILLATSLQLAAVEEECSSQGSEYRCSNGHCISYSQRCDGYNDCWDNSDENCESSVRSGSGSSDTGVAVGVSLLILICCCLCCCGGIGGLSSKGSTTTTTVHPVPSRIVRVIAVTDD